MLSYLKPCPYCGKKMILDGTEKLGWYFASHKSKRDMYACKLYMVSFKKDNYKEAKDAWNKYYEEKKENADEGSV